MRRLDGRAALVMEAAQEIGAAIAIRPGQEGASVVLADIDHALASATAVSVGAATSAATLALFCEAADPAVVSAMQSAPSAPGTCRSTKPT
jgi:NAD(P)-dependent dehydrogenase (short-subunit alcohol dehydrogenase family)